MIIAPSLLAENFFKLNSTINELESLGIKALHIDVMDGQFVPEITIGSSFIKDLKAFTKLQLDVHLMVRDPDTQINQFIQSGADIISFQIESARHPYRICQEIINNGKIPGIAVNPGTPIELVFPLLPVLNQVTIMTVNPGYSRQNMIYECLNKISLLKKAELYSSRCCIKIDGGVNENNIGKICSLGANWVVVGGALFNNEKLSLNLIKLQNALKKDCKE